MRTRWARFFYCKWKHNWAGEEKGFLKIQRQAQWAWVRHHQKGVISTISPFQRINMDQSTGTFAFWVPRSCSSLTTWAPMSCLGCRQWGQMSRRPQGSGNSEEDPASLLWGCPRGRDSPRSPAFPLHSLPAAGLPWCAELDQNLWVALISHRALGGMCWGHQAEGASVPSMAPGRNAGKFS